MSEHVCLPDSQRLRPLVLLVLGLVALIAGAGPVSAQVGAPPAGRLSVEVTDPSGALVAGAMVMAQADGLAPVDLAWVADEGVYRATGLAAARYVVTVVRDGFGAIQSEVTVAATGDSRLAVGLQPAAFTERITVEGAATRVDDTALKLPTALLETARSLTVFSAERIKEQNFRSVSDALLYVPGMSVNSYRAGSYHFYSRGYRMGPNDTRVDGFVGLNAGGRYGGSMFGVEDVVFLRGPAGILYGSASSPGGMVNLVTKKPQPVPVTTVDVRTSTYAGGGIGFGQRGTGGIDFDSTGPVPGTRRVTYRALFTAENMDYFTSGVTDRNRYASGSVRIALDRSGRHQLTPIVMWTRFNRPQGGGFVASPSTSLSTNDGVSRPINTFDLSPLAVNFSSGGGVDDVLQGGAELRGAVTDRLRYSAAYRFVGNDTEIDQFTPVVNNALLASSSVLLRTHARSNTERRNHNYDANGVYEFKTGGEWRSLVQAGVTGRATSTRQTSPQGPAPAAQSPINIYTGVAVAPLVPNYPAIAFGPRIDATYWTSYVQNQTTVAAGRLVFTLGLGYGADRLAASAPSRSSGVMPNASVLVRPTPDTSVYASYSTSYNPADPSAENASGIAGTFGASRGINAEAGVKGALRRTSWALAVFHNEIDNALVQSGAGDFNPNGNRYFIAAGTRRSRGVELSGDMTPVPNLVFQGSISYLDAIYTGAGPASAASTLAIPGSRAEKSPVWSWSLLSRYTQARGRLAGLGASLGVAWQAERLGSNGARTFAAPDPLVLPAFTRVDAGLFYRLGDRTSVALNIENLLDELIFVNASVGSSIEVAAPRTLSLRVGYRF
ncbi:MAG: TonB-dependent receptor [Acidobacteria bacterium]|nr:TonB-dependent receptor [Acidobacteriota bacterium]